MIYGSRLKKTVWSIALSFWLSMGEELGDARKKILSPILWCTKSRRKFTESEKRELANAGLDSAKIVCRMGGMIALNLSELYL